jgi:16S rRNA (guanine527-N7)-methyltransferase
VKERTPLPADVADLPALGPAFEVAVVDGAAAMGVELSAPQRAALEVHARLLLAWNAHINLTSIRDPLEVARLHVADSLTAVPVLRQRGVDGARLLDLGSGGGYPGLPLAATLPFGTVVLLDSVAKKVRFLGVAASVVARSLGAEAPSIEAVQARAEDLARAGQWRATFDVVTVRAVGSLSDIAELGLPLLRQGGSLLAWKRQRSPGSSVELRQEIEAARQLIAACGGAAPRTHAAAGSVLPGHVLVRIDKVDATPQRYPRDPVARTRARSS